MKIGIVGYKGRVGALLVEEVEAHPELSYAGGTEEGEDADSLFADADAVIDFTVPEATRAHIALAAKHKTILVIATTGLTTDDEAAIEAASKDTTIIYSANYSVAVNILMVLAEQAAAKLGPDFDLEIVEAHHKYKVDAPSGTALMIGKACAEARGLDFDTHAVLSREGIVGARKDNEIGFSTIRGGDAVGEHTVYFIGDGERIEIKQQATNRSLYAKGALRAALWAKDQPAGLYSMRNVLDL